jgi:hypothetical protein
MSCKCACISSDCNSGIEECDKCRLLKAIGRQVLRQKKYLDGRKKLSTFEDIEANNLSQIIETAETAVASTKGTKK